MIHTRVSNDWLVYERKYVSEGYNLICGIDEAGRGPLAGPVCAAAVILPKDIVIEGVNDSKKLSPKKREYLFEVIKEKAFCHSVAFASSEEIDQFNILRATHMAMVRAVENLTMLADFIMVDGDRLPNFKIPAVAIIKGDALSVSIAAASILAKVSRDRFMVKLDEKYPQYGFAQHKGYGTKQHAEAIIKYGMTDQHRVSFIKFLNRQKLDKQKVAASYAG